MDLKGLIDCHWQQPCRTVDDPEIVEAALLQRLDRFGDRMVPKKDHTEYHDEIVEVYHYEPKVRRRVRHHKVEG